MKFKIEATSNINKYIDILKKYSLEKEKKDCFITINNLEELIKLHKETKQGIIIDTFFRDVELEIYDTYRE